jgi:hypothetical protein
MPLRRAHFRPFTDPISPSDLRLHHTLPFASIEPIVREIRKDVKRRLEAKARVALRRDTSNSLKPVAAPFSFEGAVFIHENSRGKVLLTNHI